MFPLWPNIWTLCLENMSHTVAFKSQKNLIYFQKWRRSPSGSEPHASSLGPEGGGSLWFLMWILIPKPCADTVRANWGKNRSREGRAELGNSTGKWEESEKYQKGGVSDICVGVCVCVCFRGGLLSTFSKYRGRRCSKKRVEALYCFAFSPFI